jgi:hypothetical protein
VSRFTLLLVGFVVLAAAVGGGVLAWSVQKPETASITTAVQPADTSDSPPVVPVAPADAVAAPGSEPTPPPSAGGGAATAPTPAPTLAPTPPAVDRSPIDIALDFDDAMVAAAIAEGERTPLVGLPARDAVAGGALIMELEDAGFDLTGVDLAIYPASSAQSMVVLSTDDASAELLAENNEGEDDDANGELAFLLISSPVLADFEVERLVLRHTTVDEEGPLIITFSALLQDLWTSIESDEDPFSFFAVQAERP